MPRRSLCDAASSAAASCGPGRRQGPRPQAPRRAVRRTRSPAASRRASGKSRRPAGHSHRSARSLRRSRSTRSTNSCTAGKAAASAAVSPDEVGGLPSGPRRCSRSPATPSGSRLVARMLTPGTPLRTAAARLAAASMTCSQLSSSSSIRLSLRAATRPGSGFSVRTSRPSTVATALGTRRGSPSGARSISQTPCFIIGDHALGDGEGDRGLADAAGPDDRHQALARQSRDDRRCGFLAADHPRHRESADCASRRRDRPAAAWPRGSVVA